MYIIVGLGNPGNEYKKTRHNVGFMAIEQLQKKYTAEDFQKDKKFLGQYIKTKIAETSIILLKPETYMNLSGRAVLSVMQFFKIPIDHVIVVYDELDLPFGKIRIQQGGSAAGHNGIRSIIEHCGQDFLKIRIGIGNEIDDKRKGADYVLAKITSKETEILQETFHLLPDVVSMIIQKSLWEAQNQYNRLA